MAGDDKVVKSGVSISGRNRGGGVQGTGAVALTTSLVYMALGGEGKRRCHYKTAIVFICVVNILAAVYVVHGLLSPDGSQIPRSVPLARLNTPLRNGTVMFVLKYSREEVKRIKEAHKIRREAEPHELMRRVKEIQLESVIQAAKYKEEEATKEKVAVDLAQRLQELKGNTKQHGQQEALGEWRKKKIEEARKRESVTTGTEESEEVVAITSELGGDNLTEAAGLDKPTESTLKGGKLVLKGPEIEDGIIPGRPLPAECNADPHTDYDGVAVKWGLTHHKESAADCCQACLDQAKAAKDGEMKCNIWVYCPSEEGCYSPDIYEHKHMECWLKQAEKPKLNFKGHYPEEYRRAHPKCPRVIPWVSGVTGVMGVAER